MRLATWFHFFDAHLRTAMLAERFPRSLPKQCAAASAELCLRNSPSITFAYNYQQASSLKSNRVIANDAAAA
jgi:hypothetical protein